MTGGSIVLTPRETNESVELKEDTKTKMECLECGKKFKAGTADPKCPKCGSHDIDLAEQREFTVRLVEDKRFVPVVVGKFVGMYRKNDPQGWAVADRKKANSTVSKVFDSQQEAQAEADKMERSSLTEDYGYLSNYPIGKKVNFERKGKPYSAVLHCRTHNEEEWRVSSGADGQVQITNAISIQSVWKSIKDWAGLPEYIRPFPSSDEPWPVLVQRHRSKYE